MATHECTYPKCSSSSKCNFFKGAAEYHPNCVFIEIEECGNFQPLGTLTIGDLK